MALPTFVEPDESSLHPACYLLANRDVAAAGAEPRRHFIEYGHRERRKQVNPELLAGSRYRSDKFQRFKHVLAVPISSFPAALAGPLSIEQYDGESANADFGEFVFEMDSNPGKLYLDLGCGLRLSNRENCLYVEVYRSITADLIVAPSCEYPIKSQSLDGIGCFAVLEHTRQPWRVVSEICRMLKPGGKVFIDWPFLQPIHGFPSHYFNATRDGLKSLFVDNGVEIDKIVTYPFQTPSYTISWVLGKFYRDLPDDKKAMLGSMTVEQVANMPPQHEFWGRLLSGLPDAMISEFACGNGLIGRKR